MNEEGISKQKILNEIEGVKNNDIDYKINECLGEIIDVLKKF